MVTIPELAFKKVVSVKRDGRGYDIVTSMPVDSRQVYYLASEGSFVFLNQFNYEYVDAEDYDALLTEKIFIIWEE